MASKKILPIGRQTFEILIRDRALYVDKTQYVYDLITSGGVYFLARPRRFGKSLLLTTFEALFRGRKDLFDGLWINSNTDYDFEEYPVILLDLSKKGVKKAEDLETFLVNQMDNVARKWQLRLSIDQFDERFGELIELLSERTGKPIVVLVDEYDKPIIDNIYNPNALEIRDSLRQFYTVLKSADRHLRFVFLTGVSKFSKVSVFSGLNNLYDISMDPTYAEICGYTQGELESSFPPWISELAAEEQVSEKEILKKINYWYNGYRFSVKEKKVYNPFSTLLLFQQKRFKPYWFETGTPTMLVRLLEEKEYELERLENLPLREEDFGSFEVDDLKIESLLFQTGYLTILDYDDEFDKYSLGYPNHEVRRSFLGHVLSQLGTKARQNGAMDIQLIKTIRDGKLEEFL